MLSILFCCVTLLFRPRAFLKLFAFSELWLETGFWWWSCATQLYPLESLEVHKFQENYNFDIYLIWSKVGWFTVKWVFSEFSRRIINLSKEHQIKKSLDFWNFKIKLHFKHTFDVGQARELPKKLPRV